MNVYRYRTLEGDRWDNIAVRHGRSAYDYVDIIEANPAQQGKIVLEAGIIISVPAKENTVQTIKPPWEQ